MSGTQTNPLEDEVAPVPAFSTKALVKRGNVRGLLRWVLTGLPLGGAIWASFLPLQTWMHQALILITLIWFYVFYLLDTFFMGG